MCLHLSLITCSGVSAPPTPAASEAGSTALCESCHPLCAQHCSVCTYHLPFLFDWGGSLLFAILIVMTDKVVPQIHDNRHSLWNGCEIDSVEAAARFCVLFLAWRLSKKPLPTFLLIQVTSFGVRSIIGAPLECKPQAAFSDITKSSNFNFGKFLEPVLIVQSSIKSAWLEIISKCWNLGQETVWK